MSVDFPRAWEISRDAPPFDHDPRCSFEQTKGAVLCDCDVLMQHFEVVDRSAFYGRGERVIS